ncbi:MAG: aminodeoxychorismate synthase component I [Verrucomicrobiota bacterium]
MHPIIVLYDARNRQWLRFSRFRRLVQASTLEEVIPCLEEVENEVRDDNLYAAGFLAYEAANAFDPALATHAPDAEFPLLWFALYEKAERLADIPPPASSCAGAEKEKEEEASEWQPSIGEDEYRIALGKIRDYIRTGYTYQVNFTLRLNAAFNADPWNYFRQLVKVQQAGYPVYIETDDWAVCSASPELFFTVDGDRLITRPMKGTIERGRTWEEDMVNKTHLLNSRKERAENVMIVDMARNDLGRIAEAGSVQVTELFSAEKYPTVWQLTSSVECRTAADITEIFQALFPAASITGAPKPWTMGIIKELEKSPRTIYTGAAGFIAPDSYAQFNVAIRTLLVDKRKKRAMFGTGGGIVWDSLDAAEYAEWGTKARILHQQPAPQFSLLETLLWTSEEGFFLLDRHLQRLEKSADYFDFKLDLKLVRKMLEEETEGLGQGAYKVRLVLSPDGSPECQATALATPSEEKPVCLGIAADNVDSSDVFLYHKTTNRAVYQRAKASSPECDDAILYNENGYITESTIANVVVYSDGEFLTPPVNAGLLNGVFRHYLVETGRVKEKALQMEDLRQAEEIYLINSVRKWRPAVLRCQAE